MIGKYGIMRLSIALAGVRLDMVKDQSIGSLNTKKNIYG